MRSSLSSFCLDIYLLFFVLKQRKVTKPASHQAGLLLSFGEAKERRRRFQAKERTNRNPFKNK